MRRSPIITRSLSRQLPPDSEKMTDQVVKHEIITTDVQIPKFSGLNGSLTLSQFIQRINTFIANRGISDDKLKIEAFKQNIDATQGSARFVINYSHLEKCSTYEDYLKTFSKHFTTESDRDPLRSIVKYLNITVGRGESRTQFISRMDSLSKEMSNILKRTEWTDKNDSSKISVENMTKILTFAQIVNTSSPLDAERLFKDINANMDVGEADFLLKKYSETNPNLDPHVMVVKSPSSPSLQRQSRQPHKVNNQSAYRPRSNSRSRNPIQCYSCNKYGHTSRQCFSKIICNNCKYQGHVEGQCKNQSWCTYHQMTGHKTQNCRARYSQNFQEGQSTPRENT